MIMWTVRPVDSVKAPTWLPVLYSPFLTGRQASRLYQVELRLVRSVELGSVKVLIQLEPARLLLANGPRQFPMTRLPPPSDRVEDAHHEEAGKTAVGVDDVGERLVRVELLDDGKTPLIDGPLLRRPDD